MREGRAESHTLHIMSCIWWPDFLSFEVGTPCFKGKGWGWNGAH